MTLNVCTYGGSELFVGLTESSSSTWIFNLILSAAAENTLEREYRSLILSDSIPRYV